MHTHRFTLMALCLLASVATASAQALTIAVTNRSDFARKDAPVVVNLHQYLPAGINITSAIITDADGHEYPSQLDDMDGDLVPDELAFTANLPAKGKTNFVVTLSTTEPQRHYPPRTDAFLKLWDRKYRYPRINHIEFTGGNDPLATYDAIYGHGAMWESEYGGFRIYMDHRQSIDIYGKPDATLVLDKTNFYSTREDIEKGLGCDILFAGQSVGVGSFRGYEDGRTTYIDSVQARGQRIIASGPVRSIVEVWDRNWFYRGHNIQMRQRYTMFAGHRDVHVDCWLVGIDDSDVFATGVQKLEQDNQGFISPNGLAGSWGRNVPDKANPDLVEGVGLGIRVPRPFLREVKEDSLNYLCLLRPRQGYIAYDFVICSAQEKRGGFESAKHWFDWLQLQWNEEKRSWLDVNVNYLASTQDVNLHYTPGNLIIFYEEGAQGNVTTAAQRYGCTILHTFRNMNGCVVRVPASKSLEETMAYFKRISGVLQVNRDHMIQEQ